MSTVTLIVIPGSGARTVNINANTTVANFVSSENLHGRDIIINGEGVLPTAFQSTVIPPNAEVFATGSVKGNNTNRTLVIILALVLAQRLIPLIQLWHNLLVRKIFMVAILFLMDKEFLQIKW